MYVLWSSFFVHVSAVIVSYFPASVKFLVKLLHRWAELRMGGSSKIDRCDKMNVVLLGRGIPRKHHNLVFCLCYHSVLIYMDSNKRVSEQNEQINDG